MYGDIQVVQQRTLAPSASRSLWSAQSSVDGQERHDGPRLNGASHGKRQLLAARQVFQKRAAGTRSEAPQGCGLERTREPEKIQRQTFNEREIREIREFVTTPTTGTVTAAPARRAEFDLYRPPSALGWAKRGTQYGGPPALQP